MNLDKFFSSVGIFFGMVLIICGAWALSALVLMLLWNWIAVGLFGLPVLSFWTSIGLCLLLSFIGSFFKSTSSK